MRNAYKSRWKYLKELIYNYPDIDISKEGVLRNDILPTIPYSYVKIEFDNQYLFDSLYGSSGNEKEEVKLLDYDEFIEVYSKYFSLPHISKPSLEYDVVRYGYSKKGTESQIDINKTLENKLKRLIMMGEELDEDIMNKLFEIPFDNNDLVFHTFDVREKEISIPFVTLVIDISGSISDYHRLLYKSLLILILNYLSKNYDLSYVYLLAHSERAYDFGVHKLKKDIDIKKLINNDENIQRFFRVNVGGATRYVEWIEKYSKRLERVIRKNFSNYLLFCTDFLAPDEDINIFVNLANNKGIDFVVLLIPYSYPERIKSIKLILERIEDKKYSAVLYNEQLLSSYNAAEVLLEITKYINNRGVVIL